MLGILFLQRFKHQIHRVFEGLIFFADLGGIEHFQQRGHVLFLLRGLVPDVGDERLVVQSLGLLPEILPAFAVLALGVLHDASDQLQDVVLRADIAEGVIAHGLLEINGIEDLNLISASLEHLPTFNQDGALGVCDNVAGVHLHQIGLNVETGLAAAGTADYQHIFIDIVLRVLVPAQHNALRLGQQDILVKFGVDKGLDVLCRAPAYRTPAGDGISPFGASIRSTQRIG